MLPDEKIKAFIKALEKIQLTSDKFYSFLIEYDKNYATRQKIERIETDVPILLSEYDYINQILIKEKMIEARDVPYVGDMRTRLSLVIHRIPTILEILRSELVHISQEQQDTLNSLKLDLSKICENFGIEYHVNMLSAIEEFESGHWLSSVLIVGRVTTNLFESIPLVYKSDENEEIIQVKIQYLLDQGALPKNDRGTTKQMLLRTEKTIRNLFSHQLDYRADAAEAMSILGNTIQIMKIVSKIKPFPNKPKE